jgi:hypothetical protein
MGAAPTGPACGERGSAVRCGGVPSTAWWFQGRQACTRRRPQRTGRTGRTGQAPTGALGAGRARDGRGARGARGAGRAGRGAKRARWERAERAREGPACLRGAGEGAAGPQERRGLQDQQCTFIRLFTTRVGHFSAVKGAQDTRDRLRRTRRKQGWRQARRKGRRRRAEEGQGKGRCT